MAALVSVSEFAAFAVLVTCASACIDFAHARYFRAMEARDAHRAGRWSVAQFAAGSVGFVVAVKVSMWLLPFEAMGLYLGTVLGGQVKASPGVEQDMKTYSEITKAKCPTCNREVAVVREDDREAREVNIRISRHLHPRGDGLCIGSFELHKRGER